MPQHNELSVATQRDHDQDDPSTICFQTAVTNILVGTEELRRRLESMTKIRNEDYLRILSDVDGLLAHLYHPVLTFDSDKRWNEIEIEMRRLCSQKVMYVTKDAFEFLVQRPESDPEDHNYDVEGEKEYQSAIARLAEANLFLRFDENSLCTNEIRNKDADDIVNTYVSYQKQVIRQRSKPSIARLVEYRKRQQEFDGIFANRNEDNGDDDMNSSMPHIQTLTIILGQATILIHPLMLWRSNLPSESALCDLCTRAVKILDEQAQSLAKTVAEWFLEDSKIDHYWMVQMSSVEMGNERHNPNRNAIPDLAYLDNVVDQLAFCCQIFDRYVELVIKGNYKEKGANVILQEFIPEWTWKYASLERYLTTQQLASALHPDNNVPVEIIAGASVRVPSVVEDAQYLSTRALKRAASTRSNQAIGTVAHSIATSVWATDTDDSSIYDSLLEQKGCYNPMLVQNGSKVIENSSIVPLVNGDSQNASRSASNSNSFAQALLGALDEDHGSCSSTPNASNMHSPVSTSSGLLGSLSSSLVSSVAGGNNLLEIRRNTYICALNGICSASTACISLVDFLDTIVTTDRCDQEYDTLEKETGARQNLEGRIDTTSMVRLAREELFRYGNIYGKLLRTKVVEFVHEFCGSLEDTSVYRGNTMIPVLRYYLERESFEIPDADHLSNAEDESRLHNILIRPINECQILQEFGKCDVGVLRVLCEEIARLLSKLFLDVISSTSIPKRFTVWGSILLSNEVRVVQNHLELLMNNAVLAAAATSTHQDETYVAPSLTSQWRRLSQAVTILQLEKPSDWSEYYNDSSLLSPKEIENIMLLRVDFSRDAIKRVVACLCDSQEQEIRSQRTLTREAEQNT